MWFAAALVEGSEKSQSFYYPEFVREGSGLQRGADLMFQRRGIALRIEAAERSWHTVEIEQAFENLDGGGFAGAVRPKQAENFSFFHIEADAADGFDVAVTFNEVFDLKNGIGHVRRPTRRGRTGQRGYSIPQIGIRPVTGEETAPSFTSEYDFLTRHVSVRIFWAVSRGGVSSPHETQ